MDRFHIFTSGAAIKDIFRLVILNEMQEAVVESAYKFDNALRSFEYKVFHSKLCFGSIASKNIKIWRKYSVATKIEINTDDNYYFLFAPGLKIDREIDKSIIENFKKYNNVKTFLLLFDSINSYSLSIKRNIIGLFEAFDHVLTYDNEDALKYGLRHFVIPYYGFDIERLKCDSYEKYDICFVGNSKGRIQLLMKIDNVMRSNGIKCFFYVRTNIPISFSIGNIRFTKKRMKYEDVIKCVANSNCILEVLCKGQTEESLRYYEAMVYGRKLLTNNASLIKDENRFIDSRIRVFDKAEDIDVEWVKENKCFKNEANFYETGFFDYIRSISV